MSFTTHYSQHIERFSLIVRYGVSGVVGAVVQISSLYFWVSVLGLRTHYLWGVVVAFCLAVVVAFLLQKYWTFADRVHHHMLPRQFVIYALTALGSLACNTLFMHITKVVLESRQIDFFDTWYLVAQAVIIFIAAIFSFLVNYFITFKKGKTRNSPNSGVFVPR